MAANKPGQRAGSWPEVLGAFTKLGLTSFGGPVAHLGYFREEFVVRRKWLDEASYGDIVALCQFLPGPASSQVGITLGILRAGLPGALFHPAVRAGAHPVRLRGGGTRRPEPVRLAARAQDRRGRG